MGVIKIAGSSGKFTVDADTGLVVDARQYHEDPPDKVDVDELKKRFGKRYQTKVREFDILNVGSWKDGEYDPPCSDWQDDTRANVIEDIVYRYGGTVCDVPNDEFWKLTRPELIYRVTGEQS